MLRGSPLSFSTTPPPPDSWLNLVWERFFGVFNISFCSSFTSFLRGIFCLCESRFIGTKKSLFFSFLIFFFMSLPLSRFRFCPLILSLLVLWSPTVGWALGSQAYQAGYSPSANGNYSTAVGWDNTASAIYASSVGAYNKATNSHTSALGRTNTASGYGSSAVGSSNESSGNYSSAVGYDNTASGENSSAFGRANQALSVYSSAVGYGNLISKPNGGHSGVPYTGYYASAFGSSNTANGNYSSAFGYGNTSGGRNASAFGYDNTANYYYASAFGYGNTASGESSSAFGYRNTASGSRSSAFGYYNTSSSRGSTAMGYYAKAESNPQASSFERNDKWLLNVGNGNNNSARSNALVLQRDGDLWIEGDLTSDHFGASSDERLKENIATLSNPLQMVESLRGVSFTWKKNNKPSIGFIAQEVEKVIPSLVLTGEDGYKTVAYGQFTALLVEAVKELKENQEVLWLANSELLAQNQELSTQNQKIMSQNKALEKRVQALEQ